MSRTLTARWRMLAHATLLLFALRTLIPVGFMPDPGLLKQGELQIVLCTAQGPTTVTVDTAGNPVDPTSPDPTGPAFASDCPFGTASAKAAALPATPTTPAPGALAASAPPPAPAFGLRPPAHGPPLGSRAPPIRLG
ncbi:MAG: DUF2946 family protein [Alphaproteobacteria bacterium]